MYILNSVPTSSILLVNTDSELYSTSIPRPEGGRLQQRIYKRYRARLVTIQAVRSGNGLGR